MKVLTEEQSRNFYSYLTSSINPVAIFLQILFETGARISEITTLSPSALEGNTLTIEPLKGSNLRQVQLSANLVTKLKGYKHFKTFGILVSSSTNPDSQRRAATRYLTSLSETVLDLHVNPHMLRHTAFTRLYVETKDLLLVKQWAGHKSINSTLVYMQADQMDEANRKVQEILTGTQD